ncbi:hypothetical protein PF003_g9439 [Phytophthora fragariae]|nr:hypothetical protein PF003_g9439 [Phytophthora fragariae]
MVPPASATEGHPLQTNRSSRIDATPAFRGKENCGVQHSARRTPAKRRKQKHERKCSDGLLDQQDRARRASVVDALQNGEERVAGQGIEQQTDQRTSRMTDYYAPEDADERNSSVNSLFKA